MVCVCGAPSPIELPFGLFFFGSLWIQFARDLVCSCGADTNSTSQDKTTKSCALAVGSFFFVLVVVDIIEILRSSAGAKSVRRKENKSDRKENIVSKCNKQNWILFTTLLLFRYIWSALVAGTEITWPLNVPVLLRVQNAPIQFGNASRIFTRIDVNSESTTTSCSFDSPRVSSLNQLI